MNFDKLFAWALGIVFAVAATGRLEQFRMAIIKAEVQILRETSSDRWGSPKFFADVKGKKYHRSSNGERSRF